MKKTRLIDSTKASRMIATTRLNKRSREDGAQRMIAGAAATKLAARPVVPPADKPVVQRHPSGWGHASRTEREATRRKAARESLQGPRETPLGPSTSTPIRAY